jgi:hypothetical protein
MKSLNKHVPLLVFLIGLACMVYSMLTFFHPPIEPERKPNLPAGAGEIFTPTPRIVVKPSLKMVVEPQWEKQLSEQMHKTVDKYLHSQALEIKLPETMQYSEVADGLSSTLLGVDPSGRISLYVFSGRGKFVARDHVQEVMKDLGVQLAHSGTAYNSRSGMTLYQYKGATAQGYDYLAYLFKGQGSQHAFVVVEKGLDKHPAAVREMVESIRTL